MAFQVVCLSAVDGAGGEAVAPLVAQQLGFRIVDQEIVAMAAREAALDPESVADVERRKSLLNRFLDRVGPGTAASVTMGAFAGDPIDRTPNEATLRGLIQAAIHQAADLGQVVIVAHAASFALQARGDAMRVLLIASPQTRADRLSTDLKEVAKLDTNRADYLKRFYDIGAEQSNHYDLVVNTDNLEPPAAATTIVALART